jgi:TetR/AcrR family transcriptional repressor of bet genes
LTKLIKKDLHRNIAMSRKSNTEQRRMQIVAALSVVLAEQGYEKATIQAIAKQAGLAPGLIHYHFKTKADILLLLVENLSDALRTRFVALSETATNPHQKFVAYIHARLAKGSGANPETVAAWVMIGAEAVRQFEVRQLYQQAIANELAVVQQLIKDCLIARGKNTTAAPQLAAAVLALMEGAFQLSSATTEVMPTGYASETVIQMVDRYIECEADNRSS